MNRKKSGHCENHRNSHGTHKDEWPIITSDEWHTQNGNIFKWNEDLTCWKQIECYLAAVPTQYGCNTFEEQFYKLTSRLGKDTGTKYCLHPIRYRTDDNNWTMLDDGTVIRSRRLKQSIEFS